MIAKIVTEHNETSLMADSVKVEDGFLKFKNASISGSSSVEEAWIPVSTCKCIIWKDKPEEEKKEDKKE